MPDRPLLLHHRRRRREDSGDRGSGAAAGRKARGRRRARDASTTSWPIATSPAAATPTPCAGSSWPCRTCARRPARAVVAGARAHQPRPRAARPWTAGERARRLSRGDGGPDPHRRPASASSRAGTPWASPGRIWGSRRSRSSATAAGWPRRSRWATRARRSSWKARWPTRCTSSARPARPSQSTSASWPTTPIRTSRGSGWPGSPRRIWPSDAPSDALKTVDQRAGDGPVLAPRCRRQFPVHARARQRGAGPAGRGHRRRAAVARHLRAHPQLAVAAGLREARLQRPDSGRVRLHRRRPRRERAARRGRHDRGRGARGRRSRT